MAAEMMTAQELTDLRLGTLDTAVSDWEKMHGKLDTLATGGGGGVSAKALETQAKAADWSGANATISKEFVTKIAVEFQDVAGQAKSVLGILRDASAAFKKHKTALRTIIDDLAKHHIYINDKGGAIASVPSGAAAGKGDIPTPTDEELAVAERRVKRVLWEASETDRIAARALRALAKNKHDFTGDGPGGLKEADDRQGKADADYWAKKAQESNPGEWSDAEIARFNETLKDQRDNPGFSERFATTLGGEGTLQFWRDMAAPPGGAVEGDRAKTLAEVQDNLSMTLATATQSESPAMDTWKREVIAAGDKPFPIQGLPMGPNGYQVMSSLMDKGKFDDEFLNDYGDSLLKYEREYPGDPEVAWRDTANLNYPPTDEPNDPFVGFMEGLGHNPEASLDFFNDSTTADGKEMDNWDYLVAKGDDARAWPPGEDGKPLGHDALGHALESATIGVPHDSDATPPKHSAGSAELVNRIVAEYGKNPDRLDASPMNDSFGNITAEYMRDVQDGLNGRRDVPTYGSNANLGDLGNDGTLKSFLGAVGKDPDAYGAILNSQQAVSTELINDAFHERDKLGNVLSEEVNLRVAPGAEIAGIMADSRTQAVYDDKIAADAEFNEGLVTADKWAGRAIDTGLARFPVAGEAAGWVVGDIREAVLENYTRDSSGEAQKERDTFLATQRSGSADAMYDATYTAAIEAGISETQAKAMAGSSSEQVKDSYGQGRQ
ncbi:hypothetical protein JKV81_15675 [Streptomyces sp. For3]|uniref:hypothetical protein n=1 Tax=Streptomyces silvae TaxID=2803812 RepID=UPI001920C0EC|nr:hypothetical protein [Streptomyces silvae]MBL1288267.1 hypothetical protein [Streptomyces silvae]